MNEKYIRETLNNHRMNKTLQWQTLIIVFSGTIGVVFKFFNTQKPVFESILLIFGFLAIWFLLYSISETSLEILKLTRKLYDKGGIPHGKY